MWVLSSTCMLILSVNIIISLSIVALSTCAAWRWRSMRCILLILWSSFQHMKCTILQTWEYIQTNWVKLCSMLHGWMVLEVSKAFRNTKQACTFAGSFRAKFLEPGSSKNGTPQNADPGSPLSQDNGNPGPHHTVILGIQDAHYHSDYGDPFVKIGIPIKHAFSPQPFPLLQLCNQMFSV